MAEDSEVERIYNILTSGYQELRRKAGRQETDSIDFHLSQTRPGMKAESSVFTATIPLSPAKLSRFLLVGADSWNPYIPQIVRKVTAKEPNSVLQRISKGSGGESAAGFSDWSDIKEVEATFQLPTPLVPVRQLKFYRCLRLLGKDAFTILDIGEQYLYEVNSDSAYLRRRPSGMIIEGKKNSCEVTWVEDTEIPEAIAGDNIFSTMLNQNLAFCARRWVITLLERLRQGVMHVTYDPEFAMAVKIERDCEGRATKRLAELTHRIKSEFFRTIGAPSERIWVTLSNEEGVRVMRRKNSSTELFDHKAVTSFRVPATPESVFNLLVKYSVGFQYATFLYGTDHKKAIEAAWGDSNFSVSLESRNFPRNKRFFPKGFETTGRRFTPRGCPTEPYYLIQQNSKGEFCSSVISHVMNKEQMEKLFLKVELEKEELRKEDWEQLIIPPPDGFAIMPEEDGGLQCKASLVSLSIWSPFERTEKAKAIETMQRIIKGIIKSITEYCGTY
ncbi:hypothetical protein Dsin_029919 [Dipteronia sinensis]|uniref:START domain-containing protein n=1 Tax=Dipteronia sinensis TaxID=43782 RepID=A0AAE0DVM2_9ROSI|nr:hypothetical protein Dsin_029919 [Dipteronia sinensis]